MDKSHDIERAQRAKHGSPYLNPVQAADYLKLTPRVLRRMRQSGKGPNYRRHGKYLQYHIDDLDIWSEENLGRKVGR
ncbi:MULTISPECIES: helix-turn-helix domain-containing protein [unclassified Novosphingobium]|uniref:helix-turn-helix domain-containing protein n=1 Tax=unclassified Novosphingobium TaxID=2644732 RepID=UPI002D785399|nr:helix-turn-helix domain-containing protein [Novosphingobium sp. RL4]WRT94483.1 helix-turn-helix domain-containing protein [Novosphingobium sp. RL4]